jgi:RNA polymerase sigma-70 factor (ECF subfamily)
MTEREEDRRRVRDLLAGDATAFDVFFEEYFPRLYRFVLPRVERAAADAQDICQETLLRALRRLSTYRGEAALFSWICQIAANQIADYWQKRRRDATRVVFAEDDASVQAVLATLHADPANSPESERYNAEIGRLVQATLDNLPGRFGDALEWKYLDALPVADIAKRLGVSIAAAQSTLQRARAAFREAFTPVGEVAMRDWLSPVGSRDPEV